MFEIVEQRYEARVPVERLRAHPKNTKVHDLELIEQSMSVNGFAGVIYAQESTGYIISGHGTLKTATDNGMPEVPVLWMVVDDDTALRLLHVYNAAVEAGSYDWEALHNNLEEMQEKFGLTGTGWRAEAADDLLERLNANYTERQEFTGDYVDDKDTRKQTMTHGQLGPRGLHEIVLVFSDEQFDVVTNALEAIAQELGGETTSERVFNAIVHARDIITHPLQEVRQ